VKLSDSWPLALVVAVMVVVLLLNVPLGPEDGAVKVTASPDTGLPKLSDTVATSGLKAEFTDVLGLCQFLPGGNIINVSIAIGARFAGAPGSVAAFAGLMAAPMAVVIGLGFLSKYENALGLVSILLFLFIVPKYRSELKRANFYLLLLCFAPSLAPPILWNLQHDWLGLEQLSNQAILNALFTGKLSHLSESFGKQIALYSPLLLICVLIALFGSIKKAFRNSKICLLLTFSWPVILIYMIMALHQGSDPVWTAPAFIGLGILATHYWLQVASQRALVRGFCVAAVLLSGLQASLAMNIHLVPTIGVSFPTDLNPSSGLHGWRTIAKAIDKFRADFEAKLKARVFMIGNEYQTSSMLSFYLNDKRSEGPGHPPVYIPESQDIQNEFSFWPRYDEFVAADPSSKSDTTFTEEAGVNLFLDRTALYITDQAEPEPPQNLQSAFTRWELLAVYELDRKDLPLRQIRIFACYQYQTLPL